eukprot:gene363-biopygen377
MVSSCPTRGTAGKNDCTGFVASTASVASDAFSGSSTVTVVLPLNSAANNRTEVAVASRTLSVTVALAASYARGTTISVLM